MLLFLKYIAKAIAIKFRTAKTKNNIEIALILKTSQVLQLRMEWKRLKFVRSKVVEYYLMLYPNPKRLNLFHQVKLLSKLTKVLMIALELSLV